MSFSSSAVSLTIIVGAALATASGPVVLPLQDVQIKSNIQNSWVTGIHATLGSPPQTLALIPWAQLNNTIIYDDIQPSCDNTVVWNDLICEVRRGGWFVSKNSSSFSRKADMSAAGGAPVEYATPAQVGNVKTMNERIGTLLEESTIATDSLTLATQETQTDFPIAISRSAWDTGLAMMHPLGLAQNSTFINRLYKAGTISSNVWSIFWGRMWVKDRLDGAVVLGGYDRGKTTGQNFTYKLDYSKDGYCSTGFRVKVNDVKLNFKNGTDVSISDALDTCIVPHEPLLLYSPASVRENFFKAVPFKSSDISYDVFRPAPMFNATSYYDGDLTLELASGLNIRVANDQFMVPHAYVDRDGKRKTKDDIRELLFDSYGTSSPMLGRVFLTAAYMMVDHDQGTFTLWQANPSKETDLVEIRRERDKDNLAQPGPTVDSDGGKSDSNGKGERGVGAGVIAGATVGAVAVVGLLILAVVWWLRSRRRSAGDVHKDYTIQQGSMYEKPELGGIQKSELSGTQDSELGGTPKSELVGTQIAPRYVAEAPTGGLAEVYEMPAPFEASPRR